jgi:acyl-CoA thioesterase FadM
MDTEPKLRFVTASLKVDYLRPTPLDVELVANARVKSISKRKVVVSIEISANDIVCVRGEVVAVLMPGAMKMK